MIMIVTSFVNIEYIKSLTLIIDYRALPSISELTLFFHKTEHIFVYVHFMIVRFLLSA